MNDQEAISPPKNRDKYLDMEEKMWRFAISIELQQNDESHERLRSAIHDFVSSFIEADDAGELVLKPLTALRSAGCDDDRQDADRTHRSARRARRCPRLVTVAYFDVEIVNP